MKFAPMMQLCHSELIMTTLTVQCLGVADSDPSKRLQSNNTKTTVTEFNHKFVIVNVARKWKTAGIKSE